MKKAAFFFAAFVLLMDVAVQAEDLQVGMTASSLLKPLQDDTHITLHRKKCHEFTTFILNHSGGRRELSLVSRAPDLTPEDIPEAARKIPLAYIAPVIGECGRAIIDSLDSMKIS